MMEGDGEAGDMMMMMMNTTTAFPYDTDQLDYFMFIHVLTTVLVPALFVCIGCVGTIGNLLVVYVILSQRRMRTVTNLLLLNLAAADITFLLVCLPFRALSYSGSWTYGLLVCQIVHYMSHVSCYVTIYTLVAISSLRYLVIVYGNSSRIYQTRRNIVLTSVAIWVAVLLGNGPMLAYYRVKTYVYAVQTPAGDFVTSTMDQVTVSMTSTTNVTESFHVCGLDDVAIPANFWCFAVFGYALPMLVICSLYYAIMSFLQRSRLSSQTNKTHSVKRSVRASRLIMLVVTVFAISWLPVHVNSIYSLYYRTPQNSKVYELARVIFVAMAYSNSSANPLIYSFVSDDFRKGFRTALHLSDFATERSTDATTKSELLKMVPQTNSPTANENTRFILERPEIEL